MQAARGTAAAADFAAAARRFRDSNGRQKVLYRASHGYNAANKEISVKY